MSEWAPCVETLGDPHLPQGGSERAGQQGNKRGDPGGGEHSGGTRQRRVAESDHARTGLGGREDELPCTPHTHGSWESA